MKVLRWGLLLAMGAQAQYSGPVDAGWVQNPDITEASGIVASRLDDSLLWTHNDSGGKNRIFALATNGKSRGTYYLDGCDSRDWEDIAAGPGPDPSKTYLFVGEIGDNYAAYDIKTIYRFVEPVVPANQPDYIGHVTQIDKLNFRFPDGRRDAEALMVDPWTGDYYVVSKRESKVMVYLGRYPQPLNRVDTLVKVATLDLTYVTAADISPSGEGILIEEYGKLHHWTRNRSESLVSALSRLPTTVAYQPEPQGEAVCWNRSGKGYYTLSEEVNTEAHLFHYFDKTLGLGREPKFFDKPGPSQILSFPSHQGRDLAGRTFQ